MNSKFIGHGPCPDCGSSDALAMYSDGHTYCFSCEKTTSSATQAGENFPIENKQEIRPIPKEGFNDLVDRGGITAATCRKYGVTSEPNKLHVYPYFTRSGDAHGANKIRHVGDKTFHWEKLVPVAEVGLFGQNAFPPGSNKSITLTEGECDAMAAFQMSGSRFPCVSVRNGAQGSTRDVADNFEYLNSFDEIVIVFDRDEPKVDPQTGTVRYPGQEAAVAVAGMFPVGKCRILTLSEGKDPNDYLRKDMGRKYVDEWYKAPRYTPSGLKIGKDMWDEISAPRNYETVEYPWEGMNYMTYGMRLSELVVFTADTGVGKTSVLKEIEHHLLKNTDKGLGLLHLEEPNSDTALGLMSIGANRPLHLPDVRAEVDKDELRKYFDATVNNDRIVIWDHFGSNSIQEVLNKIRHMHNLGCKYIVVDHLSIVVSDQSGDERKQLDEISTKLKTLCMELNIAVLAVIHQNRQGQIRGTAGVEQLANIVVKLHRDKEDPDPWRRNVTKLVVQKNRFCGRTGPGSYLFYDEGTGRLYELDKEKIKAYESGATGLEEWPIAA